MVYLPSITAALAVGALPLASAAGLHQAALAKGLDYFGTATDNPELTDSAYVTQLNNTDDFGQITPGNSMKWDATEPSQNTFSFTKGDVIANLADANDQKLRCHNLVWYSQLPNWVNSGSWTNETLTAAMKNHITKVVDHYKGRCYAWDVVNEALNEDGTYRDNVFYKHIGEAYLPIAFATAAAADPDVKLYYNDYNIEWAGNKASGALRIVKLIQSYGVKIDGVGLQGHFTVGNTPGKKDLASTLKTYTALGVEVAYTEIDVRMETPATDAKLAQQSTDFQNLIEACVDTEKCVGFTIWDWTDKYSWVPSTFSGQGAALPWDEDFNKKPAYTGLLNGLGGSASPSSSSSSSAPSTTSTTKAVPTTSTTKAVPTTTTTKAVPTTSTTKAVPSSTSSSSTVSPPTETKTPTDAVQRWGQCGGNNWTGSTTCVSGTTCQKQNDWYYQCL